MASIFLIVCIIISVLLALIVLIQNPKGGGVNSQFGGVSNQIFGASKSTDVVEKATWYLAGILLVLCLSSGWAMKSSNGKSKGVVNEKTELDKNFNKYKGPKQMPNNTAPMPGGAPTGK
jgi:preprotein translocase subunit SecG